MIHLETNKTGNICADFVYNLLVSFGCQSALLYRRVKKHVQCKGWFYGLKNQTSTTILSFVISYTYFSKRLIWRFNLVGLNLSTRFALIHIIIGERICNAKVIFLPCLLIPIPITSNSTRLQHPCLERQIRGLMHTLAAEIPRKYENGNYSEKSELSNNTERSKGSHLYACS